MKPEQSRARGRRTSRPNGHRRRSRSGVSGPMVVCFLVALAAGAAVTYGGCTGGKPRSAAPPPSPSQAKASRADERSPGPARAVPAPRAPSPRRAAETETPAEVEPPPPAPVAAPAPPRAPAPETDIDRPLAGITASWIGNTFPHGRGGTPSCKWVPQNAADIHVTPDGTVFTNVFWEEGGANNTEIKEGDVLRQAHGSHGWGHQGGDAVAANSTYVYCGHVFDNEGGGLVDITNWPPKGKKWFGVSRRNRSDIRRGDPFEGGKGGKESPKGCFLVVLEVPEKDDATIKGLHATQDELFASCPYDDTVKVYDARTMKPRRSWPMRNPAEIAMDRAGSLWIVVADGTRVVRRTPGGRKLAQSVRLPDGATAGDICVDAQNRLLVADAGRSNQVLIYQGLDARPRLAGRFGEKGGVYAGAPGERGRVGPRRFLGITGLGADDAGNVYVASSCRPFSGLRLESYSPRGELNWRVAGIEFVSRACEDPGDQTTLYSQGTRYVLDYSEQAGREWSYRAHTYDLDAFPDAPGLCSPLVRRIGGKKLIFACGQNAALPMAIFRFAPETHGEIAIPCGFFAERPDAKNPNAPAGGGWIWTDRNGDGRQDAGEFQTRGKQEPWAGGYWVDEEGDLWFAGGDVRRFEFQGFTAHGAPLYDFDHTVTFEKPQPFAAVKRLRYDAKSDVMYLGGTTPEHKNQHWKGMGPVLCRFDRWSEGNRTPRWTVVGRYDPGYRGGHVSCEPLSFDVAGDFVFVALAGWSGRLGVGWAHIDVYHASNGKMVGWMEPPKRFGQVGLMDMVECLRVFRRPDGEYVVIEEDDYAAKNLLYRWRPQ